MNVYNKDDNDKTVMYIAAAYSLLHVYALAHHLLATKATHTTESERVRVRTHELQHDRRQCLTTIPEPNNTMEIYTW